VEQHPGSCDCYVCQRRQDFVLSEELLDEILAGDVTLFVGSGVSTENRHVLRETLYERIAAQVEGAAPDAPFPQVMEQFCAQPNGRFKLLKEITGRFDNIDSFPELASEATRFHRELGTLFPVRNIITTNWDTYFERYCHATPFVTDPDLAFWEAADRRVLKIHGSVTNYGSVVATTSDYASCEERLRTGLIGGVLTTILATQTVVFIGYSLSDSDFAAIYGLVKERMDSLHRQAYVVTPSAEECERFAAAGLIPIATDGGYFVECVKERAVEAGAMLDDSLYEAAYELLNLVDLQHDLLWDAVKMTDVPEVLFSGVYQDGLRHALERAVTMRGSGEYSHACNLRALVESYLALKKEKLRARNYPDVAYIEGYVNGLIYLLMAPSERESTAIPMYYAFGTSDDLTDIGSFLACFGESRVPHKAARRSALAKIASFAEPDSMVVQHPPWL